MTALRISVAVAVLAVSAAFAVSAVADADASQAASGYTIQVSNSGAGGDPGYFYVGGPLNITVKKLHGTSNAKVTIQMAPNPIDRKGPFTTRVGRTYSSLAPSRAGRTGIRVDVGGKVLRRTIRVRTAH